MEKVQKIPTVINEVGQPDNYGNRSFSIQFNDNTSGFFRCREQNLFTVGVESTFYYGKATGKTGKEYYKIERVEKHENDFDKKSTSSPKKSSNAEKFMCLSYAKDIMIAFNGKMPSPTEVTAYAEVLYSETINGKKEESSKVTVQIPDGHQAALNNPSVEENKLPF